MDFFQVNFCSSLLFGIRNRGFWHPQLLLLLGSDEDRDGPCAVMPTSTSKKEDEEGTPGPWRMHNEQIARFRPIPALPHALLCSYTDFALRIPLALEFDIPFYPPALLLTHLPPPSTPYYKPAETGGKTLPATGSAAAAAANSLGFAVAVKRAPLPTAPSTATFAELSLRCSF